MTRPTSRTHQLLMMSALCVVGSLTMATTCGQRTTVVANDTTPPTVSLYYGVDGSGSVLALPASGIELSPDKSFCIYGATSDPQGARSVLLQGELTLTCTNGGIGRLTHAALAPQSDSQTGGPGSSVYNGLWVSMCHQPIRTPCPAGWSLSGMRYSYGATGSNFSGLTSSAGGSVRISTTPPPSPTPTPPPAPVCPTGQRCCGAPSNGSCQCWPQSSPCP